jgi:hypothetical protein
MRVWQNDARDHRVERFLAYHNGGAGIFHGAYDNRYKYVDCVLVSNADAGIRLLALRRPDHDEQVATPPPCAAHAIDARLPEERLGFWNVVIDQSGHGSAPDFDHAVVTGERNADAQAALFDGCAFQGYKQAAFAIEHTRPDPSLDNLRPDRIDVVQCTFEREPWFHIHPQIHPDSVIRIQDVGSSTIEVRRHDARVLTPPATGRRPQWRWPGAAEEVSPLVWESCPPFYDHDPLTVVDRPCPSDLSLPPLALRSEREPEQIDLARVEHQARQIKQAYPEIYDYLVRRDEATTELVRQIVRAIPSPGALNEIQIPFIDVVIEIARPADECPICQEEDDRWYLLSPEWRAKLCDLCRSGIYLRGTGIGSLAE